MRKIWMLLMVLFVALLIIVSTMVLGVNNLVNTNTNSESSNPNPLPGISGQDNSAGNSGSTGSSSATISLNELANHNTRSNCWIVYKNKVYDLTSWLPIHPGGANAILQYCGTQGFEQAFIRQHGTRQASLFIKVAIYMGDFKEQGAIQ